MKYQTREGPTILSPADFQNQYDSKFQTIFGSNPSLKGELSKTSGLTITGASVEPSND
jgi:hypothetical protein